MEQDGSWKQCGNEMEDIIPCKQLGNGMEILWKLEIVWKMCGNNIERGMKVYQNRPPQLKVISWVS